MAKKTDPKGGDKIKGGGGVDTLEGGDGNEILSGGAGNDILSGGGGSDELRGAGGNDVLDGGAGSDVLLGGADDDVLAWDAADSVVDGGSGTDVLRIDGAGQTLDVAAGIGPIRDIEVIDLTGSGNNTLNLSAAGVVALLPRTGTLRVHGDAGDKVTSIEDWVQTGPVTVGGVDYIQYTNGAAVLQVQADVAFIQGINDAPVNTVPGAQSVNEDES